jgi:hypothetical protein
LTNSPSAIRSTCANRGQGIWSDGLQGLSRKASQRIAAIESRQDDLDEKLSQILAGTKAHTEALDKLKAMFAKYVGRFRESNEGSPSVSKSALENQVSQPSQLVDSTNVENVDIRLYPECKVDVQDSSHAWNSREMVNVVPVIQKTAEKAQKREKDEVLIPSTTEKREKDEVLIPFTTEKREKDQVSVAPTATKSNVSPGAATPPPTLVPSMPNKPQQKQSTKAAAVAKQFGPVQLSPRRLKPALEKTPDLKPTDKEVKGGSSTSKAKTMETATDDSNPYSLDGAIDGLLEVGGSGGQCSPQKLKKPPKTGDDEGVAIPTDEALSKVRNKDKKLS